MKTKTRGKIEKLIERHNVYIIEDPEYMLSDIQLRDELEALIEREREVAKIAVDNIRAKIDNFRRETIDENRAITMGGIVYLISEIDWKVKELESYLQSIKKEGGE